MSETNKVEGQEPDTSPQKPGASPQTMPEGQEPESKPTATTYSEDYVKDLRKEAATYRTKASDAQKQLDTVLTELNTLKSEQKATKTQAAFTVAATEAGAVYPDPIFALVSDKIKTDEAGTPDAESLKTVLEDTKKAYPALFKATPVNGKQVDAGAKGDSPKAVDFNAFIRQNLGIQ